MTNPPAYDPNVPFPAPRSRFPVGAAWLIGLGIIFLIGNAGIFHGFAVHLLLPFFLIGLGVWIFIQRMTSTGGTLADDGTPLYRIRLFGALRGSVWIILVGLMFLLANFNILSWGRSWPLFIIVAGLMVLAEKTVVNSTAVPMYPMPPYTPPPSPGPITTPPPAQAAEQNGNEEGR
jgi:hypothetical protein